MVSRIACLTAFLFVLLCCPARADVFVNTSLNLTSLTITPTFTTSGSFLVNYSPSAFVSASAEDSLGGAASSFDFSPDDPATTGPVSTTLAGSSSTASASGLTGSATGGVNIPGTLTASAGTEAQSYVSFFGSYEIEDMNNPSATEAVNVSFSATAALNYVENLVTDLYGEQAASNIEFELDMPDATQTGCPDNCTYPSLLFFADSQTIGPSTNLFVNGNPSLTATSSSVSLQTNTIYGITIELDAESSGINTPEPGYYLFLAVGLSLLFFSARRLRHG